MNNEKTIKGEQINLLYEEVGTESSSFRPIHYLGSKLRILDFIKNVIDEVDPSSSRVCDLFSGSGTVSHYLSQSRPVTAIDIQEYSRVLTSSVLNPLINVYLVEEVVSECLNSEHYKKLQWCLEPIIEYEQKSIEVALKGDPFYICELLEKGSIVGLEERTCEVETDVLKEALVKSSDRINNFNFNLGPEALTTRYFGGSYFSFQQALLLDILLEYASKTNNTDKDIFVAAILSVASDAVNTVGKQFAQPLKAFNADGTPKKNIINKIVKDRNIDIMEVFTQKLNNFLEIEKSAFEHYAFKMDYSDALDILSKDVKVVYADPPYTRYHYSRYYHVLETLCLRDNPVVSRVLVNGKEKLSRGIYRKARHQSPFSIKSKAYDAFDTLFTKVSNLEANLVLSYSPFAEGKKCAPRIQKIEELESLARKHFKSVETLSVGQFSHSKLNNTNKNFDTNYEAELFIVCKK